jgi:hypothetical protein
MDNEMDKMDNEMDKRCPNKFIKEYILPLSLSCQGAEGLFFASFEVNTLPVFH